MVQKTGCAQIMARDTTIVSGSFMQPVATAKFQPHPPNVPFYKSLWAQVVFAITAAVVLGHFSPTTAIAMKPFGDAFIRLITMIITLVVFCTVVSGIAGVQDVKTMGRVGGKALLYFEFMSTFALFVGLLAGHLVQPGAQLSVNLATLDAKAVTDYAGAVKTQSLTEFLAHVIPATAVDALAKGDILAVLLIAILFGLALSAGGRSTKPVLDVVEALKHLVFKVVILLMKFAPIGAFGAMAYTVGKYGLVSLGPLFKLIAAFYVTCFLFVLIVLGLVTRLSGFHILSFLGYIKEEILLVVGVNSSEAALPALMQKLENLGCSKSLVGLVVPSGYTFNTDGTSLYVTLAALFVAQATHVHLSVGQQLALVAVATFTSKGASGVQGAAFIALVGTLALVPAIPVAGMALLLGIERFMSTGRALVNMIGNAVATVVVARWEGELDGEALQQKLARGRLR